MSIPASSGKAQSNSSSAVPSAALTACGHLEQVQVHRPVGAEQLSGGDPEQQRVADLAGGAGDGHLGGGHLQSFSLSDAIPVGAQGYASMGVG